MNNIDSLTLKYFYDENKDFIDGAIVQKSSFRQDMR